MEIDIDDLISNEDNENPFGARCPFCRNSLKEEDLINIDVAEGSSSAMFPTIECLSCKRHIILSQELMEKIKKNDKETNRSSE